MKNFGASQRSYFTGTERYFRVRRRHLLTEGTKYLAEEAECFWMMFLDDGCDCQSPERDRHR